MLGTTTSKSTDREDEFNLPDETIINDGFSSETFMIDGYSEYIPSSETGFDSDLIQTKEKYY